MQSLQMLPAHFHNSTIQVVCLYARTQKEQAAAAAAAAAVVRECSVNIVFSFLNSIKLIIKLYTHTHAHTHTHTHTHVHTHEHTYTYTQNTHTCTHMMKIALVTRKGGLVPFL